MFDYPEGVIVAAVAIFLSSVILFPSYLSSSDYSIVYAAGVDNMKLANKTSGIKGNNVLTVGPGADPFNCGPMDNIIKDPNKIKGNTTSNNCESTEEPIDCNLILNVIKELQANRNALQERLQKLQSSTNQETDLDAGLAAQMDSLRSQINSLDAQISQQQITLQQCSQTNIDKMSPSEPKQ